MFSIIRKEYGMGQYVQNSLIVGPSLSDLLAPALPQRQLVTPDDLLTGQVPIAPSSARFTGDELLDYRMREIKAQWPQQRAKTWL
jgi:hypothetical protein